MKSVRLREEDKAFASVAIFKQVMGVSPQTPLSPMDIRARCRVIRALEKLKGGETQLVLEDADYETLKKVVNGFPYSFANEHLERIFDDIDGAETIKE